MPRMWTAAGRALRGGESGRQAARSLGQKKPGTRGSEAKRSYCTAGSGYETIRRKAGRDRHERRGVGREGVSFPQLTWQNLISLVFKMMPSPQAHFLHYKNVGACVQCILVRVCVACVRESVLLSQAPCPCPPPTPTHFFPLPHKLYVWQELQSPRSWDPAFSPFPHGLRRGAHLDLKEVQSAK